MRSRTKSELLENLATDRDAAHPMSPFVTGNQALLDALSVGSRNIQRMQTRWRETECVKDVLNWVLQKMLERSAFKVKASSRSRRVPTFWACAVKLNDKRKCRSWKRLLTALKSNFNSWLYLEIILILKNNKNKRYSNNKQKQRIPDFQEVLLIRLFY
jgi:hypothetical protein